jgi:hypothetical protein
MKKLLLVTVLVLGAIVANAQRTPVKVSDLPKGVSDDIQKEYTGYTIKESNRVVANNTTTYEVIVSKGTEQKTLLFDNEGKSIKSNSTMDKSKSPDSWDMEKDKAPSTDMDKSKAAPSNPAPSPSAPSPNPTPAPTPK